MSFSDFVHDTYSSPQPPPYQQDGRSNMLLLNLLAFYLVDRQTDRQKEFIDICIFLSIQ